MEIQSPAGASRDALARLPSVTRAAGGAEESRPAKAPPQAPQPRFHVEDYTAGARLDTLPPGSTVEKINIDIGPWVDESLGWSPRRPSRRHGFHQAQGFLTADLTSHRIDAGQTLKPLAPVHLLDLPDG